MSRTGTTTTDDQGAKRLAVVGLVAIALFVGLIGRLWFLQVAESDSLQVAAAANRVRTQTVPAPRGRILDVQGRVLIDNRAAIVVAIDRREFPTDDTRAPLLNALSSVLTADGTPTTVSDLIERINDKRFDPLAPVPIAEDISEDLEVRLRERSDELAGVVVERRWIREYPYGASLAHVLGYVGPLTGDEFEAGLETDRPYVRGDEVGRAGIEKLFEEDLRGIPGQVAVEIDARNDPVRTLDALAVAPIPGHDVHLTIDIDLQASVELELASELRARRDARPRDDDRTDGITPDNFEAPAGSVVVLNPDGATVEALASYPTYAPDIFIGGVSTADWEALRDPEADFPLLNRAIAGEYAPGSTFKLFTAHAAVVSGLLNNIGANYNDQGVFTVQECTGGSCSFRNAGSVRNGNIGLVEAIVRSSDTYFYRIGEAFWIERTTGTAYGDAMQASARAFGLGSSSGIALPGESGGFIPDPELSKARHDENPEAFPFGGEWFGGNNVLTAIGQGEVVVTPLQLANAYGTFANGGTLYSPNLVTRITEFGTDEVVRSFGPRATGSVDLPDDARGPLLEGLEGVTSREGGTAVEAFSGFDAYLVAGKTGTAEVGGKQDTALFVGFGPSRAPEHVVVALLEEAGFGSAAAAPVVRRVFETLADPESTTAALTVADVAEAAEAANPRRHTDVWRLIDRLQRAGLPVPGVAVGIPLAIPPEVDLSGTDSPEVELQLDEEAPALTEAPPATPAPTQPAPEPTTTTTAAPATTAAPVTVAPTTTPVTAPVPEPVAPTTVPATPTTVAPTPADANPAAEPEPAPEGEQ